MDNQKEIFNLLREQDDFKWVRDASVNIFEEYDGIWFDTTPTRHEVSLFIDQALHTNPINIDFWTKGTREVDIDKIINERPYLYKDITGRLVYSRNIREKYYTVITFSDIKNGTFNESEDDLGWMDDIQPTSEDIFKLNSYDLSSLDGLVFGNGTGNMYSFCYECTIDSVKTLIYDITLEPHEKNEDEYGGISSNGSSWTWIAIRKNFIGGDWYLVHTPKNINESDYEQPSIGDDGLKWIDDISPLDSKMGLDKRIMVEYGELSDTIKSYFNISESEDGLSWIDNVTNKVLLDYTPNIGDTLICLPGFYSDWDETQFDYESDDLSCGGGGYTEGRVVVVGSVESIDTLHGTRNVVWPNVSKSKKLWNLTNSCFACGVYVDALTPYLKTINESEDTQ